MISVVLQDAVVNVDLVTHLPSPFLESSATWTLNCKETEGGLWISYVLCLHMEEAESACAALTETLLLKKPPALHS